MAQYTMSRETIFNLGFWLVVGSDLQRLETIKLDEDQITGIIAALIDRGVNTPAQIRQWMRKNGLRNSIFLVDSILGEYVGTDRFKHLWKLHKCDRYSLLFDFTPYRYDIEKRVADLTTLKDVLLYN